VNVFIGDAGLPEVVVKPFSQSVEVTHTAIFTTSVSGVGVKNFTYQWRHNGVIITNKTGDTLMITNAMESDSGDYDCFVTNQYGDNDTSKVVVLMITSKWSYILIGTSLIKLHTRKKMICASHLQMITIKHDMLTDASI